MSEGPVTAEQAAARKAEIRHQLDLALQQGKCSESARDRLISMRERLDAEAAAAKAEAARKDAERAARVQHQRKRRPSFLAAIREQELASKAKKNGNLPAPQLQDVAFEDESVPESRNPSTTSSMCSVTSSIVPSARRGSASSVQEAVPKRSASWDQVFSLMDEHGDGKVDMEDVKRGFHLLQVQVNEVLEEEIEKMFSARTDASMSKENFIATVTGNLPFFRMSKTLFFAFRSLVLRARMFREMFALFDRTGQGHIGTDALGEAITRMFGWRPTRYQSHKLLSMVDPDGDGSVNLLEFVMMMNLETNNEALQKIQTSLFDVHEMFQIFDLDVSESSITPEILISTSNFSQVLSCLGYEQDRGEMQALLDEFDADGGGEMDFVEFADMMTAPESRIQCLVKERVGELRRFFNLLDEDKGGTLTLAEMCTCMRRLGRKPSDQELEEAVGEAKDPLLPVHESQLDFQGFARFLAGNSSKAQRLLNVQLREYREAFNLFDADGGGDISVDEFISMMNQMGLLQTDEEAITEAIWEHDIEKDGEIDFVDFMFMMISENELVQRTIKSNLVGFREAFNLFDTGGDGSVTTEEFIENWNKLGFTTPEHEVRALLESIDEDGDGEMGFEEFVSMLTSSGGASEVGEQIRGTLRELRHAWSLLDPDGDGSISAEEMFESLNTYSEDVTIPLTELQELMVSVDDDGNGELDFSEFAMIMSVNRVKAGILVAKVPPLVTEVQAQARKTIPWERCNMILELDGSSRTEEMCEELAGYLRKLGDPTIDHASTEVLTELGKTIFLRKLEPFEMVFREGDPAGQNLLILDGSVSTWKKVQKVEEDEEEEGDLKASLQGVYPVIWSRLESEMSALLRELKQAQSCMPSGEGSEHFSELVKDMVAHLNDSLLQTSRWFAGLEEMAKHDLQDLVREHPEMLVDGKYLVNDLNALQKLVDSVHCQQLLQKFYLQLCVAPHMLTERLEPPFGPEQAEVYLAALEQNGRSFVVVDATRDEQPITWCSDGFCELTGYTRDEVRGKNCRILQSKETDRPKLQELRTFLEGPSEDPKIMLVRNKKKDGTAFDNLLTIYGVHVPGPEGEPVVDQWIGAQVDITAVTEQYRTRQAVQGVIDVCQMLLATTERSLAFLGPCFGVGKPEYPPVSEMRDIRPTDQVCGFVPAMTRICNLALCRDNEEDVLTVPRVPVSCYASSKGATLLCFTRDVWLQVHALEPVKFLQNMGFLRRFDLPRLQRLATSMRERSIPFRSTLVKDTDASSSIFLVKRGQLKVREVNREVEESTPGVRQKRVRRRSIALVGQGDALDQSVYSETQGAFVYGIDAVANTDDTVVYQLSRASLEAVSDGVRGWELQNSEVTDGRAHHRKQMCDSVANTSSAMASQAREGQIKNDMGWKGDYRISAATLQNSVNVEPDVNVVLRDPDYKVDTDTSLSAIGREWQDVRGHKISHFRRDRKRRTFYETSQHEISLISKKLVGLDVPSSPRTRTALDSVHNIYRNKGFARKEPSTSTPLLQEPREAQTALPEWSRHRVRRPKLQPLDNWNTVAYGGGETQVSMYNLVTEKSRVSSRQSRRARTQNAKHARPSLLAPIASRSVHKSDYSKLSHIMGQPRKPTKLMHAMRARLDSRGRSLGPRHLMMAPSLFE